MEWHKKYETGNEEVDNEHKEIFALVKKVINAAFDSQEEKIETTIDFLADYTIRHFAHEERIMEESNYPDTDIHKKQHQDFVKDVVALKERVMVESDSRKSSIEVNNVIVDWLTAHVLGSDKVMAEYYRKWSRKNK